VPTLDESLSHVQMVEGVRAVALVDIGTGMVVRSAGDLSDDLPAAAASMADEARLASQALGPARPGGDLEEITVVTPKRFQLLKVLELRRGDGLLLFVDFDRSLTNIALAALQIGQLTPALLA
jgi:predicted regulator of Ras-like GTPase activity (Roadblock/LC7/MglB family)